MATDGAPASRLYLIDASGYVHRAFHALPQLTTTRGQPTNATLGVARMLTKLLREEGARQLVVVFDAPGPTFRGDLYAGYKEHRPQMADELRAQFPYVRRLVDAQSPAGAVLERFKLNMEQPISAILIVNTAANTAGAAVAGAQARVLFGESSLLWFSALFTLAVEPDQLTLHLAGTCSGCPGVTLTTRAIIEPAVHAVAPSARVVVTNGITVPEGASLVKMEA